MEGVDLERGGDVPQRRVAVASSWAPLRRDRLGLGRPRKLDPRFSLRVFDAALGSDSASANLAEISVGTRLDTVRAALNVVDLDLLLSCARVRHKGIFNFACSCLI